MTLEELLKAQGIEDAKISAVLTSMKAIVSLQNRLK